MSRVRATFDASWLPVVWAVLGGALAGLLVALVFVRLFIQPQLDALSSSIATIGTTTTRPIVPTEPPVEIIPVEARPLVASYPVAFAQRRESSVLSVVRRGKNDGEPVGSERVIGSAVAVTSDGWLATTDAVINGTRVSDMMVAVAGRLRPIERAVRDRSTGIVYLKVPASDLPTPAFVRSSDVVPGAAVWVESEPLNLAPNLIISVRSHADADPVSSERAGRRFLISGEADARVRGAAVWDGAGRLIGLVESPEGSGGWRVIPAAPIGSSLNQYLQNGLIQRASLGVRAYDLSGLALDIATSSLPELGAWLHADRKTGLAAVSAKGPSARLLLEGDVIERIERDILDGTADVGERLLDYRPGVTVTLSVRRKGEDPQIRVLLGAETVSEVIK